MSFKEQRRYSMKELETLQQQWSMKEEAQEDPDYRQKWVEEGITTGKRNKLM